MRRIHSLPIAPAAAILAICFSATPGLAQPDHSLTGSWSLIAEKSSDVDPWRSMALTIESTDQLVTVFRDLIAGRDSRKDTLLVPTDGQTRSTVVPESKKWLEQPHLGVFFDGTTSQHVTGAWLRPATELMVNISTTLQTSQAESPVEIIRRFILSEDGSELTLLETRSSRPRPINLVFARQ
ncbi:MAG TPA: hypothetical protein VMO47_08570 [Rhodothermales bacterium]|nr:hypothetical protein [Rhodothermales bacterium]